MYDIISNMIILSENVGMMNMPMYKATIVGNGADRDTIVCFECDNDDVAQAKAMQLGENVAGAFLVTLVCEEDPRIARKVGTFDLD